jgi:hypothetical protein
MRRTRTRISTFLLSTALLSPACESDPAVRFVPNTGDPKAQNGFTPTRPFTPSGDPTATSYAGDTAGGDDNVGRAEFCSEGERSALIEQMVVAPIVPDVGLGLVPLRAPDGSPLHADDLLGKREDGGLCNPSGVYLDAYTWGPTDDVIVLFDQDTKLVTAVIAYQQYLGTLSGQYTSAAGEKVDVTVRSRERVTVGSAELDEYASRAEQARRPRSWLANKNITAIYAMIRETFFQASPFPAGYDCVAAKACDIIYTAGNESSPQDTVLVFRDSGVNLFFSPEGQIQYVYLEPVRKAPFESAGTLTFGAAGSSTMALAFDSTTRGGCSIALATREPITFGDFKARCIDAGDARTLNRASYVVDEARDAVDVEFNDVTLSFQRQTSTSSVFKDGERPRDSDQLFGFTFTRSLEAPVAEFSGLQLVGAWEPKLRARLRAAVGPGATPVDDHPLARFSLGTPFLFDEPQAIGEIFLVFGQTRTSWVPATVSRVVDTYRGLSAAERARVDARVLDERVIIETFVDAVLSSFTHGASDRADAVKLFRTTDDRRWVIGRAHFFQGGVPFRVEVQYSLNYGAISAVFVERGVSETDAFVERVRAQLPRAERYYGIELATAVGNPLGVGGAGVEVVGFDRRLQTLEVEFTGGVDGGTTRLVVPGEPIRDQAGYRRQIRGERFEFVAADEVRLLGKENRLVVWVERDATTGAPVIGRVEQRTFKGALTLCPGLAVRYGDDVRRAAEAWAATVPANAYNDCELVFNYSPNGNVLTSVASLKNKAEVTVVAERAVTAALWR